MLCLLRSWRGAALAAIVVALLVAFFPLTVLRQGPVLELVSSSTKYSSALYVPTVTASATSNVAAALCSWSGSCERVSRYTPSTTVTDAEVRSAALTVPGVSVQALRSVPQPYVDAVGTSFTLAAALYYVAAALDTPLTCSVAASGRVDETGRVWPSVGTRLKYDSVRTDMYFLTASGPDVPEGALAVHTVSQAYDLLRNVGCVAAPGSTR